MHGGIRSVALPLLALVVGFSIGAVVVYRATQKANPPPVTDSQTTLVESTKTVLQRLKQPVELRAYVLFTDDSPPTDLRAHAAFVNDLVSELERYANGRIVVTRFQNWSRESTESAARDGVTPVTLPQGDPCYLGIALSQENRRETLPHLNPEWSAALESDVARAIERVGSPPPARQSPETQAQADKASQSIKQIIPNPQAISLDDGKRILRDASLQAYQTVVAEMNREVAKAEEQVQQAAGQTERTAALEKLQQVRTSYARQLREIAQQSQAEIEAWSRLKAP